MRQEFLPAIGPYVTEGKKWRHPIHWLDPKVKNIFYPKCLASYALWRDSDFPYTRDELGEGSVIFGDSGGYTVVTQSDVSIDPTEVIRWQMQTCTRGVMLDIPPYRPGSAIQFRGAAGQWWGESLIRTKRNVERALPYYLNPQPELTGLGTQFTNVQMSPFKWWGVVQGESRDQMEEWHETVAALYPFDQPGEGWALAPKPSTDLLSCTRYMRFAHDKNLRNVHLLQVTAEKTVGVVLALGVLSGRLDLVTYDSASALRCAINRSAIVPEGIGMGYIKETSALGETTVADYMHTCPCQACGWFREDYPLSNSEYPHYILLHNHLIMTASFEMIFAEAQRDPDKLLRWAAGSMYGDVLREWEKELIQHKTQTVTVPLGQRI